jgi:hypothetical protein
MLFNATALAIATVVGFSLIYAKLPRRVRKFMEKHSLITDLIACILTYSFLGGTLVALMASALVGIIVSLLLKIQNEPENFLYVFDAIETIKGWVTSMNSGLNEYGKNYRIQKEQEAE